jgi:hypothetical protein
LFTVPEGAVQLRLIEVLETEVTVRFEGASITNGAGLTNAATPGFGRLFPFSAMRVLFAADLFIGFQENIEELYLPFL